MLAESIWLQIDMVKFTWYSGKLVHICACYLILGLTCCSRIKVTILTGLTKLLRSDTGHVSYTVANMSSARSEWLRLLSRYGDHYSATVTHGVTLSFRNTEVLHQLLNSGVKPCLGLAIWCYLSWAWFKSGFTPKFGVIFGVTPEFTPVGLSTLFRV